MIRYLIVFFTIYWVLYYFLSIHYFKNTNYTNVFNNIKNNIKNNILNNNKNFSNKSINTNQKKKWTSDKIIPLNKYNKDDCTNDDTCIIKPDNLNLFPRKHVNKWNSTYCNQQKDCIKDNSCVIKPNNLNLYPPHDYKKYKNQTELNIKTCLLCSREINIIDNPITEHFSSINPYRPESLYKSPEDVLKDEKLDDIINKLSNNVKENKSNTNIPLNHIKKLANKLCRHCKVGLCVNDACYSL